MYGKLALILAVVGLLISLVQAQAGEPIPVLLNTQNEAQRQAWQDALKAAFDDQTLIWVVAEKDADIVITAQDEKTVVFVRQNAVQRLSPILEPAPPVILQTDDVGVYAVGAWRLAQGDCTSLEAEAASSPIPAIHRVNCTIIAAYQDSESPSDESLLNSARSFYGKERFRAARNNRLWLWYKAGDTKKAMGHLNREIITARSDEGRAFWYGKRAQFYALDFDYQSALEDLDRAIADDSDNPLYLTRKGEVYLLLYEWNNVKDAFDAAIALDPEFALAYFQRGILLSTMTDVEGANADFSMYLSLAPRGVYAEMARQYLTSGASLWF